MIAYRLTCLLTGKFYIGITRYGLERRVRQHFTNAKHYRGTSRKLYVDMATYPRPHWVCEVMETALTWGELLCTERRLIDKYQANALGYNLTTGGQGTIGHRFTKTPEQVERSARHHRGTIQSESTKMLMRNARLAWYARTPRCTLKTTANPKRDQRIMVAYFSSNSLDVVAPIFGITPGAVCMALKRFRKAFLEALPEEYQKITLPLRINPYWTTP